MTSHIVCRGVIGVGDKNYPAIIRCEDEDTARRLQSKLASIGATGWKRGLAHRIASHKDFDPIKYAASKIVTWNEVPSFTMDSDAILLGETPSLKVIRYVN